MILQLALSSRLYVIHLFGYLFYKNFVVTPKRRSLLNLYNFVIYTKKPTVCEKSFWLLILQKSCSHINEAELVISIHLVIYTKKPTVCNKSFWLLFLQKTYSYANEAELLISTQSCNFYQEADCSVYVRSTKKRA